jgi:hypothetical protein
LEALLAGLEASFAAQTLRSSRWLYAAVNAGHIFGIALLIGAILPLDLRLIGVWRQVPHTALVRVLVPVAASGLTLAVVTGSLMFAIRAREYAGVGFFQAKLAIIALGALGALTLHHAYGFLLEGAGDRRLAGHAVLSLLCWPLALVCGRLIAFAAD